MLLVNGVIRLNLILPPVLNLIQKYFWLCQFLLLPHEWVLRTRNYQYELHTKTMYIHLIKQTSLHENRNLFCLLLYFCVVLVALNPCGKKD